MAQPPPPPPPLLPQPKLKPTSAPTLGCGKYPVRARCRAGHSLRPRPARPPWRRSSAASRRYPPAQAHEKFNPLGQTDTAGLQPAHHKPSHRVLHSGLTGLDLTEPPGPTPAARSGGRFWRRRGMACSAALIGQDDASSEHRKPVHLCQPKTALASAARDDGGADPSGSGRSRYATTRAPRQRFLPPGSSRSCPGQSRCVPWFDLKVQAAKICMMTR